VSISLRGSFSRRVRQVALGVSLSAGLAVWSVVLPGTARAAASSSIVVAYANAINTLDPQQSNYAQTNYVDSVLYEPLVTYDAQNKLEGVLATEYTLSPDATSVSITLRSGVTFHDGTPLTATDVQFSLDRYKQLGTGVASFLAGYKSTTVINPLHLTINLSAPNSLFLGDLTKLYILDAALLSKNAGSDNGQTYLATHDVGTGPFEVTTPQNTSGDITVMRYPKYWAYSASRPSSIIFRRIDESSTEREELQAGNINLALNLSAQDASVLRLKFVSDIWRGW
jgi:peptide/nickel transport system substrate-binding protein